MVSSPMVPVRVSGLAVPSISAPAIPLPSGGNGGAKLSAMKAVAVVPWKMATAA